MCTESVPNTTSSDQPFVKRTVLGLMDVSLAVRRRLVASLALLRSYLSQKSIQCNTELLLLACDNENLSEIGNVIIPSE